MKMMRMMFFIIFITKSSSVGLMCSIQMALQHLEHDSFLEITLIDNKSSNRDQGEGYARSTPHPFPTRYASLVLVFNFRDVK